jgi:serine/threonine protein kinase/Tfp pilus assembly protein PilF
MVRVEKCSRCGVELPRDVRGGQCPRCLLQLGLTPAEEAAPGEPEPEAVHTGGATAAEHPGDVIGRFRLIERIGHGGFGVVFRAEQQEPVRRQVALKVIKLGMDTEAVIARFEAERQALALMDHPNIARVFDGGTTPTGRPYLVMELVNGTRITEYCDSHRLSLSARLGLFVQVCEAIQHAHQKGIIHRDIKPSNVLVTEQDGKPMPKVIDFGIAKATLGQRLTEETLDTAFRQFAGTPAYMSPEQAGLGGLDIDSRSDIYSLGMLLYELLTDQPAFDAEELKRAAIDEIFRAIREREPPRPSTKLTTFTSERLAAVAQCRRTDPAKLPGFLRGDLDWIVMKALEKNRNRRYETANGLAMDVQRHLNLESVLARPPSRLYRLRKLIRRNRLVFGAAGAVSLALVLGLASSIWQAVRARRAERGQIRVAQFLKDTLTGVGPSVALGRDTTMLREILDKTAARLGKDLKEQPEVEADLRGTMGAVYLALGDYTNAEAMCRQVLALRQKLSAEPRAVANALNDLGNALDREGRLAEAEAVQRKALAIRKALLPNDDPEVATSLSNLASVLWGQGNLPEAERLYREALAIRRKRLGNNNEDTAASLDNLAGVLSHEEKFLEAETMQREAVALNVKLLGKEHPEVATSMNNLADTLQAEGKLDEAETLSRDVLTMRRKLLGNKHSDVALSLHNLASVLRIEGKLSEAEALLRESLAMRKKLLGNRHIDVASSLNGLAAVLILQNKLAEAEPLQREALDIQKEVYKGDHQDIAGSISNLGALLWQQGKVAEAETFLRQALAMFQKVMGTNSLDAARTLGDLGTALRTEGKLAEAESASREGLAIRKKLLGNQHADVAASLAGVAAALFDLGKLAEAENLQREELALWKQLSEKKPPQPAALNGVMDSMARLTRTLLAEAKFTEAESLARECSALCEEHSPDDWSAFHVRSLLGGSLLGQNKFTEAEPLLLAGYEGMQRRADAVPPDDKPRLKEALRRVIRFYEACGKPERAADWKKRLESGP